jgi:hypothetical protein
MELFPKDFVPELNTKNLGNCPSFLTTTQMILSTKRFSSYGILTIDITSEFYFWTEQRWNRFSISSLKLAETLEVPNTISEENSLSFPLVH